VQDQLTCFLATGTRLFEESVTWGNGALPLRITYYLGNEPPPLEYVSSVRAIVFRNRSVLVVKQTNGHVYILPGGRVEKGENLPEALRREILEETGWTLSGTNLLGFMHLHHLGAKPQNYEYPYPDFLWPIYCADAKDFVPEAKVPDEYVFESDFRPVDEVMKLTLVKGQLALLEVALRVR
jgi:8-oxo-dGTP pyrophosphatase MutT (NUDIX family)